MDKNLIYEASFKTIKENVEWGIEGDSSFAYFVDGIVAVTDAMLELESIKDMCNTNDNHAKLKESIYCDFDDDDIK